jgi:hypothetical protein
MVESDMFFTSILEGVLGVIWVLCGVFFIVWSVVDWSGKGGWGKSHHPDLGGHPLCVRYYHFLYKTGKNNSSK